MATRQFVLDDPDHDGPLRALVEKRTQPAEEGSEKDSE